MTFRRATTMVFVFLVSAIPAASALSGPKAEAPLFEEDWFVVSIADSNTKKYVSCGHMHSVLKSVGDEVHSKTDMLVELKRMGAAMTVRVEQSYRETADGKPLGLRQIMSMGAIPETLIGVVEGDKIRLTSMQLDNEKVAEYPFDPGVRFAWGQHLAIKQHGLRPGTEYTLKGYEPALRKDGPLKTTVKVIGKEVVDVLDKSMNLHRISNTLHLDKSPQAAALGSGVTVESELWVDDDFKPIVMTTQLGGIIKIKMFRTTREHALKRGAPPEMFLEMMVCTDRQIGRDADLAKLRLSIRADADSELPTLPDTSMQTFERVNKREGILTIRRSDWNRIGGFSETEKVDPNVKPFLQPSTVCDSEDKRIRRRARKAVRDAKTPAEKADALRRFVTGYITDKGMDVGFATASEVVRNRSGDCSEHGVLLAAMARAAGLPARGVTGIVEAPSRMVPAGCQSAFGYHMWTQVYIGDQWVDVDAALHQTECDPTHIALTILPLGDEGMMEPITDLIPLLGQLEIEVLDVK